VQIVSRCPSSGSTVRGFSMLRALHANSHLRAASDASRCRPTH
jgi:hypothetical protein